MSSSHETQHESYTELNAMLHSKKDGKYDFASDKEACRQYFLQDVNRNTVFFHSLKEKIEHGVKEGYYVAELFDQYSFKFVKSLFQKVYGRKFRFKTFFGAYKFYTAYAMKTTDGSRYLERLEDRVCIAALHLARGDEKLATELALEIIDGRLQLATPTYTNAGKRRAGEMVSCFLLRIEDNMESISRGITSALQLSKRGGGVALLLSNLREAGAPIKEIENQSSGVLPVMKLLEDSFSYANQLGARQGAGAVYLNVHHPDILRFLDTRRENADEKIRIKTLSLGVVVPDITMQLAKKNEPMYLFSPYDVERVYGKPFSDISITEKYYEMVENPDIRKTKINARDLFATIAEIQTEAGYPYILYEDTATAANIGPERINMSNLCVHGKMKIEISSDENGDNTVTMDFFELANLLKIGLHPKLYIKSFDGKTDVWKRITGFTGKGESSTFAVINADKCSVKTTMDHEIFTTNRGWTKARDLTLADELVVNGKVYVPVESLGFIEGVKPVEVFDLTVEDTNAFYANGILVHNCVEILQQNTVSTFNPDGSYQQTGRDISCNLASMNIALAMAGGNLRKTVDVAVRSLSSVSDMTNIESVPSVALGNRKSHSIGLGQMNLHGFLGQEKIHYGSPESIEFVHAYFAAIAYYSILSSNEIAIEKGETFDDFAVSKYADGSYFKQYLENDYNPKSEKIKKLFEKYKISLPTIDDWKALKESVMEHGIYNRYLRAVPPTGSISYINNSTSSIHPITKQIEIRKEGKTGRVYYPAPGMTNDNLEYFKDAYEIGPYALIDVYAAATVHTDQGLSMTLFIDELQPNGERTTTRDINKAQIYAFSKGIKTIYYVRVKNSDVTKKQPEKKITSEDVSSFSQSAEECLSCTL